MNEFLNPAATGTEHPCRAYPGNELTFGAKMAQIALHFGPIVKWI